MKYLGCAYYPEYWGMDRVETDARLMQEAAINLARIGEFAWSRLEPLEGQYDLAWLHHAFETLGRHGIQVLMCTPTAAPPAWLTSAYPDVCLVKADGSRARHGQRRHYCTTSDTYRRHSARITEVLVRELARHPNLAGWQLDNEFGSEMSWCYCDNCQARFQAWLRAKYGSLSELNNRWGLGFWSHDYSDWRQVRLGCIRDEFSSRNLDSKRFWSAMMIDFARQQAGIIRRLQPGTLVTTNGMGPIYGPVDYYDLFSDLDVACDDLYFDIATQDANAAALSIYRSLKPGQRFWLTETGSGALDHNMPPQAGQFRAWMWSSLAQGGDAHVIFRWRTCLSGQEQELQGILEHSGLPCHRYRMVQQCFTEMRALCAQHHLSALPLPRAAVAIVQDYQTLWAYEAARVGTDVNYAGLIFRLHQALYDRHVLADFIPAERPLTGYRLVILPSTVIMSPLLAQHLTEFVAAGGTVLALGQIGLRDTNNNYLTNPGPAGLQDLLGCTIHGGMYLNSHVGPDEALWVPAAKRRAVELPVTGPLPVPDGARTVGGWAADVELRGGEALLSFTDGTYAGQPAVVRHTTGRGQTLYAGTIRPTDGLLASLLEHALSSAGIAAGPATPPYVEIVRRGDVTFIVSHRSEPVRVTLGAPGTALLGTFANGVADLPAHGVCLVQHAGH